MLAAFFGDAPMARSLDGLFTWLGAGRPNQSPGYDLAPLGQLRPLGE